jgi:hypothetical protein
METNDRFRQYLKNKYPEEYRQLLRIEQANEEAMQRPRDELTIRLEDLAFCRGAVNALSDTHYFSSPSDRAGEYNLVYQRGDGVYSNSGELCIYYEPGVEILKPFGRILKEGFYTLDEFELVLTKMEGSHFYRDKKDRKRLPVLSILQRSVYDSLPLMFAWSQGKEIAVKAGMSSRTLQRFLSNGKLFSRVKNGSYAKKIIFTET